MPTGKANLGENFYPKLVQISREVGMKPEDLLVVMCSESGLNNTAHEQKYNGGGLIGFMPDTLKALNYKGTPEEFRQLTGADQLDYVKKLVQSATALNGGPLTSATLYYIANFYPAALKLPGIRAKDPNAIMLEQDPPYVEEGNEKYSKKYYDVGIKLPAKKESAACTANWLFWVSKRLPDSDQAKAPKQMITYGSMDKQVQNVKTYGIYINALKNLQASTNYVPGASARYTKKDEDEEFDKALEDIKKDPDKAFDSHEVNLDKEIEKLKSEDPNKIFDDAPKAKEETKPTKPVVTEPSATNKLEKTIDDLLKTIVASEYKYKGLYKKYLPTNYYSIKIEANDFSNGIECGRILSSILEDELLANAYVHSDGKSIEVECKIHGNKLSSFVNKLTKIASNHLNFQYSLFERKSIYDPIKPLFAFYNYNKFVKVGK